MVCGGRTSCQSDDHSGFGERGGVGLPPQSHGQGHHPDSPLTNEHCTKTLVSSLQGSIVYSRVSCIV